MESDIETKVEKAKQWGHDLVVKVEIVAEDVVEDVGEIYDGAEEKVEDFWGDKIVPVGGQIGDGIGKVWDKTTEVSKEAWSWIQNIVKTEQASYIEENSLTQD